jgi:hypothetical protein
MDELAHLKATPIALKMAVAIGIGMLVGMERKWSQKRGWYSYILNCRLTGYANCRHQ